MQALIVDDQAGFRRAAAHLPKADFGPATLRAAWLAAQGARPA